MKKTALAIILITAAAFAIPALAQRCGPDGGCGCGICILQK